MKNNPSQLVASAVLEVAPSYPAALRADLFDAMAACSREEEITANFQKAATAIREAEAAQLLLLEIVRK